MLPLVWHLLTLGNPYHNAPVLHNCNIQLALSLGQILLLLNPYNFHPPLEVVVTGIVVAGTGVGISYTGLYFETVVPPETTAEVGIEV